ncbi:alpha/beta-hydrolase family protein [Gordonia aichiensis]|uniref:alpha/beta-hydrolase family protein n=1 Tax=Gordonia aichiensis TaxID=36820 RepID=UPI00326477BB
MTPLRVRPAVAVGAALGRLLVAAPGMLPRSALLATGAAVVATLIGMGLGAAVGAVHDRFSAPAGRQPAPVSGLHAGVIAAVVAVAVGFSIRHESVVRAAVGAAPIGWWWALAVTIVPVAAAVAVVAVPPRVWAAATLAGTLAAGSLVWSASARADGPDVPARAEMLYSSLRDGGDFTRRAERLVDRWADDGGLSARAVVVAVPTGSGWVDTATVDGFVRQFAGSVRVLALQYDDVPSWRALVSAPDRASDSAIALLAALERRLAPLPSSRRPRVYLAGQSLGAVGADAARRWAQRTGSAQTGTIPTGTILTGTILAGVPAGTVPEVRSCERRVVLANHDDPVTVFSPALLWRPPASDEAARFHPWLPVASMVATALDLIGSLAVPVGHGHRYGLEQGSAAARLPAGCQPIGPRAAS